MQLNTPISNLLVCKICERQIDARLLGQHSLKCKDAAELKDKVLNQKIKLSTLINKAVDLRNQLTTNFAIYKKKQARRESFADDFQIHKKSISSHFVQTIKKAPHKASHFLLEKAEVDAEEAIQSANIKRREKRTFTYRRHSNPKVLEYHEEFARAVAVLKAIIQYNHSSQTDIHGVDENISNDIKIKNEVNLLYVEIKDKQISEYLQQFLEMLTEFIKIKKHYLKKQEEIEKEMLTSFYQDTEDSVSSDSRRPLPFKIAPLRTFRLISLEDADASDSATERKPKAFSSAKWLRRGSVDNPMRRSSGVLGCSNNSGLQTARIQTSYSKFASPLLRAKDHRRSSHSISNQPDEIKEEETINIRGKISQKLHDDLKRITKVFFRFEKRYNNGSKRNLKATNENNKIELPKEVDFRRINTVQVQEEKRRTSKTKLLDNCLPEIDEICMNPRNEFDEDKKNWKKRWSCRALSKSIEISDLLNKEDNCEKSPKADTHSYSQSKLSVVSSEESSSSASGSSSSGSSMNSLDENAECQNNHEDIFKNLSEVTMKGYYSDSEVNSLRKTDIVKTNQMSIDDFQFLKFVGAGAYGRIYLVRKKTTGDIYAIKIVDYADRETTHNKAATLRAERDAYKSIKGDWVVKAYYTFTFQNCVCFVLEYMIGGDIQGLLERYGCFEESIARFYFAELVLAVQSLHDLGIVHRDLKPDNVLIDANGHIKLTDFGLSENGLAKLKERVSSKTSYTRNNSFLEQSEGSHYDIISQLDEITLSRGASIEQSGVDPEFGNPQDLIRRLSSVNYGERSPSEEEPYIIKNKNDEEIIFNFLNAEERRNSWMPTKKLTSSRSNSNLKKKEMYRIVGTPDYMAPEIVKGDDCNSKNVDLWSLGVILYEFLVGIPPFNDDSVEKVFANITQMKMEWPNIGYGEDCISPEAADLIKKLLNPNPCQRLTIAKIKSHPFFKGFKWDKVKEQTAPIIPQKKDLSSLPPMTINNIFAQKAGEGERITPLRSGSLLNEITSFNMKRVDLLHQWNQNLYNQHIRSASERPKDANNNKGY